MFNPQFFEIMNATEKFSMFPIVVFAFLTVVFSVYILLQLIFSGGEEQKGEDKRASRV